MMMPANFSAISENEMTYVEGGAVALADILAPVLEVKNWQTFNTNMVTLIGNHFVGDYINRTVGTLFGGSYVPGDMLKGAVGSSKAAFGTGADAVLDKFVETDAGMTHGATILAGANGVLNAVLNTVGTAAAIYNLSTGKVENKLPTNW